MNLLIRGAHILDPKTKKDGVQDLLIQNGKIAQIGKSLAAEGAEVIEAAGLHLMPGFVDLHTHFREPGFESKETIQTGSRAAIKGGFVASVSMPNTRPPCDHQGVIDNIIRKAKEVPYHLFPAGTISKGREGKELSEMADLKQAGIVAVTDDGDWVADSLLMRRALEYASMLDLIVMSHCEEKRLSGNGVMNEGLTSTKMGLRGIPAASEVVAVSRELAVTWIVCWLSVTLLAGGAVLWRARQRRHRRGLATWWIAPLSLVTTCTLLVFWLWVILCTLAGIIRVPAAP